MTRYNLQKVMALFISEQRRHCTSIFSSSRQTRFVKIPMIDTNRAGGRNLPHIEAPEDYQTHCNHCLEDCGCHRLRGAELWCRKSTCSKEIP